MLVRGDAVDDAIGADFGRLLVENRHAGLRARLDRQRGRRRSSARVISCIVPVSGGTTEPRMIERTGDLLDAAVRKQASTSSPSSSAVRSRSVASRQLTSSRDAVEDAEDDVGVADVDG